MNIMQGRDVDPLVSLKRDTYLSGQPLAEDPAVSKQVEVFTTSQVSQAWAAAAAALVAGGALFQSGPLFGLGVLLAAAIGAAWLWTRWCMRNLVIERRFSQGRAFWGEEVDMSQVFTNMKPLPVPWLGIEDQAPSALKVTSTDTRFSSQARRTVLKTGISMGWYERVTRHYTVKCMFRGEHEFGPLTVESGDIFGLFKRVETVETPGTLLVYPRYVPVAQLGIPARQPFGDFASIQRLATDPLRLRAIREYAYGDSLKHVHWKATARRGALQTKLFETSATPQLFIFCNQDTFEHIWEGIDPETLELTITVAASIANYALEEGYMVGLQVNAFQAASDRQVKVLPGRSPDQLTRILENLARIKGWSGLQMEELIRAQRHTLPLGATIVVVTGIVTDGLMDILSALRRAGHPVALIETTASRYPVKRARSTPVEGLRGQGITYHLVEVRSPVTALEELAL